MFDATAILSTSRVVQAPRIKQKEVSRSSEIHLKALKVMDLFREDSSWQLESNCLRCPTFQDQSGKGLEGLPSQAG